MKRDTHVLIERNKELFNLFISLFRKNKDMSKSDLVNKIIHSEAPCFFISREEASRICRRILQGKEVSKKGNRRELYFDFCEIVKDAISRNHSFSESIDIALSMNSPKWYLNFDTAIRIINKSIKEKA